MANKTIGDIFQQYLLRTKNFDRTYNKLKILSAENGRCKAEMKLGIEHMNCLDTMHGGLQATLVDMVSSIAIASHELVGKYTPHLTISLNTNSLSLGQLDDVVAIDAETLRVGKKLAFLNVTIRNKKTGKIIATGSQAKSITKSMTYDLDKCQR